MVEPITIEELLKAVESATRDSGGEGFTTAELRAIRPMSVEKSRTLIGRAIQMGLVRASRKICVDISGRSQMIPSYVIVKSKPKGKQN